MTLKDWLQLTRYEHAVMVFFTIIVAQAIVTKSLSANFIYPAIGPALITLGAFAWNDYFGLKSDRALKRLDRPLVSGKIKQQHALVFSVVAMIAGTVMTFFINDVCFAIALLYTVLSMAYDLFLKKFPLAGNIFIASSMAISFVYANYAVASQLNQYIILFSVMSLLAGLGRELIITLRDVEGDKKLGARTLPMLIGPKNTIIAANTLIYLAIAVSLYPLMKEIRPAYVILIVAADVVFVLTTLKLMLKQDDKTLREARNLTLYALIIGIIGFATLAFG